MLSEVFEKYSCKFNQDIKHRDFYLYWLENDILLELNDNIAVMNGIQPNLRKAFSNHSVVQIIEELHSNKNENQIKSNIERLWDFLPDTGKTNILYRRY